MVGIEKNFDIMFFLCVVVCLAAFRLFVTLVDVAILFRLMYDGPDGESTWEFFIFSPIRKRCRLLTITDPSFIMLQIIVLCCAAPILVAVYVFLYYNAIAKHRLAKPNGREWEQITDQYLVAVPLWFFCLINVVKSAFRILGGLLISYHRRQQSSTSWAWSRSENSFFSEHKCCKIRLPRMSLYFSKVSSWIFISF